jgi:hypothetical protein
MCILWDAWYSPVGKGISRRQPTKRRQTTRISNNHHYQVDLWCSLLANSKLLVWLDALIPRYPNDFSTDELIIFASMLYIVDVWEYDRLFSTQAMCELSQKKGGDEEAYLLCFVLSSFQISSNVACRTTTAERCFAAINLWALMCTISSMMIVWMVMLFAMWRNNKWREEVTTFQKLEECKYEKIIFLHI